MAGDDDTCELTEQTTKDVVLALVTIAGIMISYSLQMWAIRREGSSHTLSYWNLFLSCLGNANLLFNCFVLTYYDRILCCHHEWELWDCVQQTFGFTQFSVLLIWHVPVYGFYLCYIGEQTARDIYRAKLLFTILIVWTVFVIAGALFVAGYHDIHAEIVELLAKIAGYVSLAVTLIVWTPQIVHTYRAKAVGALSIPALCMQAPGSALFAYVQAFSQQTDVTTFLPACSVCVQQFVLLGLCFYYRWQERKAKETAEGNRLLSPVDGTPNNLSTIEPESVVNVNPQNHVKPRAHGSGKANGAVSGGGRGARDTGGSAGPIVRSGSNHRQPNEDDEEDGAEDDHGEHWRPY